MKTNYCLAALIVLMIGGIALAADSQESVAFTAYVHEGDLNGTLLSGVEITGQDAAGSSFDAITDSSGSAIIYGQPGTWKFEFAKNGYDTLNLSYDVTQTDAGAAYLEKTAQSQSQGNVDQSQSQDSVDLTIYVHKGDLNGTLLSGVEVTGQDAAGNSFDKTTSSDGAVTISGMPGTWKFTFAKNGYETLDLTYDVTQTEDAAAYIEKITTDQASSRSNSRIS